MDKHLSKHFHNYQTMSEAAHFAVLNISEKEGIDMSKVIVATSFCFDELNHQPAKMNLPAPQGCFVMGGLAGYPFVGEPGLTAFADHIPDNGAALFIFGSHIGVTRSGEFGKVKRVGQARHTNACGALMSVQNHLLSTEIHHIEPSDFSHYQPEFLAIKLLPYAEDIRKAEIPILKTTQLVYNEIEAAVIELILNDKSIFGTAPVYILGGITINTDETLPNYFAPNVFRRVL